MQLKHLIIRVMHLEQASHFLERFKSRLQLITYILVTNYSNSSRVLDNREWDQVEAQDLYGISRQYQGTSSIERFRHAIRKNSMYLLSDRFVNKY
jgi:hypothetical protein